MFIPQTNASSQGRAGCEAIVRSRCHYRDGLARGRASTRTGACFHNKVLETIGLSGAGSHRRGGHAPLPGVVGRVDAARVGTRKGCFLMSAVRLQMYEGARRHAATIGLPSNDRNSTIRVGGSPRALLEAMEAPLAEADPHPGRRWDTWDIPVLPVVDIARIGLLNVRVWRF